MMAFQFAGQSTFVALGKSKQAVFFSIFRKVIIVVPLTLILPKIAGLGTSGVFIAEPVSNFIGGSACYITMLLTVWRKLGKEDKIMDIIEKARELGKLIQQEESYIALQRRDSR